MTSSASILVIDDDEAVRVSLCIFFEDSGFTALAASSAEEALEIMDRQPVDVAVVDLRLPAMDGVTLIREAHARWPEMAFIVHTGSVNYGLPEDIRVLPQVSRTVYLKPVPTLEVFCREVHLLLGKKGMTSPTD